MQRQYGMGDADAPAADAVAITPANSLIASKDGMRPRALYIGSGGNVVVYMTGETTEVTFANVPGGTILPLLVDQVRTSTTATNIVALF